MIQHELLLSGATGVIRTKKGPGINRSLNHLVEVAGIEPASEDLSRQASTCVVRDLLNPYGLPRTGFLTGESAKVSLLCHRQTEKLAR